MYDTESVFNVLAADDTERRVSFRRALALAHQRVESRLGSFLRQASSQDDFDARLAACRDEFVSLVASATEEHRYDNPVNLAESLRSHYIREAQKQSGMNMQQATPQQMVQNQPPMVPPPTTPQQAQQMGPQAQMPQPLPPQDLGQQGLEAQMQPQGQQPFLSSRRWTPFLAGKTAEFFDGQGMPAPDPMRNDVGEPNAGYIRHGLPKDLSLPNEGYEHIPYEVAYDPNLGDAWAGESPQISPTLPPMGGVPVRQGNKTAGPGYYDREHAMDDMGVDYPQGEDPEYGYGQPVDPNFDPWAGDPRYEQMQFPQQDGPQIPGVPPGPSIGPGYIPGQRGASQHEAGPPGLPADRDALNTQWLNEQTPDWRARRPPLPEPQMYADLYEHPAGATEEEAFGAGFNNNPCRNCGHPYDAHEWNGTHALCPAVSAMRAARTAETGNGNTDLGEPEPKMDKRKWTPETVKEPKTDDEEHPTKRKDILEPIQVSNEGDLKEIGENRTERVDLPANSGDAGWNTDAKPAPSTKRVNLPSNADPVSRSALD